MAAPLVQSEQNPRNTFAQWFGVLGAPIAWLIQFQINYSLVAWVCRHGNRWALHVCSTAFLCLAICAGLVAWRTFVEAKRRTVHRDDERADARSYFMGMLGMITSGLFALGIVIQAVPSFILNPCQD